MEVEKMIHKYMQDNNCSRLEAIANLNLCERSEVAIRLLYKRHIRNILTKIGVDTANTIKIEDKVNSNI